MNSVDFLLTNKDITYEIRMEIKRLGRPIPDFIISKTDVGKSQNYSRNFNSSVYDRFKQCLAAKLVPKLVTDRPTEERPATQHDDSSASVSDVLTLDASTSSETFSETDITSNSDDDISLSEEVDAQSLEQEMETETIEVDNFIL
ncbi:hypothetical protein NQ318_022891, partial [Aromia moschata]